MASSHSVGNALRILSLFLALAAGILLMGAGMTLVSPPRPVESDNAAAVRAQALIRQGELVAAVLSIAVGGVLCLMAVTVFRYSRRHFIEIASDSGGPATRLILYLRDFGSDPAAGLARLSITSEEEQLMNALGRIGKAMAVGRPGEKLPQIGASRVYFTDAEWQDRVATLIRAARLVVIRTGNGPGLQWEVQQIVNLVRPEQLLVAVSDLPSFQAFRTSTASTIQWPATDTAFPRALGASIRGFLTFDRHWVPTRLPLRRLALLRLGLFHQREFRSRLKPVIDRLALP